MNDLTQSRRRFLQSLSGLMASVLFLEACSDDSSTNPSQSFYPPRVGKSNPFVDGDDRPILVCVEGQDYDSMLQEGLNRLGGLQLLLDNNQAVLIKPNCNYTDSYPGISSVDSITGLINAVRQVSTGPVRIGDQGYHSSSVVYPHMGLEQPVADAGGSLIEFSQAEVYTVRRPGWSEDIPDCYVYTSVYDAPVIINCCLLKRHHAAVMTSSLKNNVGTVLGPMMTRFRQHLHSLEGDAFQQCVAEIAGLVRPELSVVDARQVLTVDGPVSSSGVPVAANKLILCGDMVATDAYGAQLLESLDQTFAADRIQPLLARAEELGLGTSDLSQVSIIEVSV